MKKIIIFIAFDLMLIASFITCLFGYNSKGVNCTKEYTLYKSVCDITDVDDISRILKNQKVEYTLSNMKLTIDGYTNFCFIINSDKSCKIQNNEIIEGFKLLEKNDITKITQKGLYSNSSGKYTEKKIYTCEDGSKVTLINNNYYANSYYKRDIVIKLAIFVFVLLAFTLSIQIPLLKKSKKVITD